ncbi:MAG: smalltalk protein, partial [Bacteroidaceae bacterium]|nr:smalltalk protein [Bacteroidaceae bacterium]
IFHNVTSFNFPSERSELTSFNFFNSLPTTTAMKNKNLFELIAKIIVAALTAALTALTTTSCMGMGPIDFIAMM